MYEHLEAYSAIASTHIVNRWQPLTQHELAVEGLAQHKLMAVEGVTRLQLTVDALLNGEDLAATLVAHHHAAVRRPHYAQTVTTVQLLARQHLQALLKLRRTAAVLPLQGIGERRNVAETHILTDDIQRAEAGASLTLLIAEEASQRSAGDQHPRLPLYPHAQFIELSANLHRQSADVPHALLQSLPYVVAYFH